MSERRPEVRLTIRKQSGGTVELAKWKSYEVEADLLTPADAFHFVASNIDGAMAKSVTPEDAVRVTVDGEAVMVGNVDEVSCDVTEEGSILEITGRDPGRFLVDCAAKPISLKGQSLMTLATKLAGAWVTTWLESSVTGAALARARKFKVDPGETVLDCLNRFAALAKVIIWLDEKGNGVIGRPNYHQKPLYSLYRYKESNPASGKNNVKRGRVTLSSRESFSQVICLSAVSNSGGLFGGGGGGSLWGTAASKLRGAATDSTVPTVKPKVISGNAKNAAQARLLAQEEIEKARFNAWKAVYTVPGHYNSGELWRINTLCTLVDEIAGIDGMTCYVVRRRFSCTDGESVLTEVELRKPGVYLV